MNTVKISYTFYRAHCTPPKRTRPKLYELLKYKQGHTLWTPLPKGGITICHIDIYENGLQIAVVTGISYCSYEDTFDIPEGKRRAFDRAYEFIDLVDNEIAKLVNDEADHV